MSASPINVASQPGAQPAAAQGIAQQGAQAQQAQGPMAGFEALLAALFGGQAVGVADPNAAAVATAAGGKTAGKGLLGGKIVSDGTPGQVKDADAKTADDTTATAAPTTPDAATLALLVPAPTAATTVQTSTPQTSANAEEAAAQAGASQTAAVATATDKAATAADAALAKLATAASVTDPATVKDAAAAATAAQQPTAAAAVTAAQTKVQAAAATPAPQLTGADGQPVAAPTPTALPPVTPSVIAQAAQQGAAAQTAVAEQTPAAPAPAASAKTAVKSARVEGARTEADPGALAAAPKAGDTAAALAAASAGKNAADEEPALPEAAREARPQTTDGQPAPTDFATASTTTPATLLHAAAVAVRGAPQTVANLAAQIAKKLDARSTRFDLQLDPAGLGKVDVRMEIAAGGKMSAALTFDTPQAAAELRARAGELQKALEQAGFDLTGGMSFDVAADRGQGGRGHDQAGDNTPQFRGRAFQTALDTSSDIAAATQLTFRRAGPAGVDVRI